MLEAARRVLPPAALLLALLGPTLGHADYWVPDLLGPQGSKTWRARWLGIRLDLPSGPVELFTPGGQQDAVLKAVRANLRPRGYRAFDAALEGGELHPDTVESARRSFMQITEPGFLIRLRRAATLVHRRPVRIVIHPGWVAWPNTRDGVLHLGGTTLEDGPLHDLRGVLLHEAAHLGDGIAPCRLEHERYGPDRSHYLHEVITPAAAFQEGWANFVSSWLIGSRLRDQVAMPPSELFLETEEPGEYARLGPAQLALGDLVSNEVYVAAILQKLAQDLGLEAVTEAMQALPVTECPTLADMLLALKLTRRHDPAQVRRSVWTAVRGQGSSYDLTRLLDGHLPASQRGDLLLRDRPEPPRRVTAWEREPPPEAVDPEDEDEGGDEADDTSPFAVTAPVSVEGFLSASPPRPSPGRSPRPPPGFTPPPPTPPEDYGTLELFSP